MTTDLRAAAERIMAGDTGLVSDLQRDAETLATFILHLGNTEGVVGELADRAAKFRRLPAAAKGIASYIEDDAALDEATAALLSAQQQKIQSQPTEFAKAILHGDDEHRAWLLKAAEDFTAGRPIENPRGKNTAEAMAAQQQKINRARDTLKSCARYFVENDRNAEDEEMADLINATLKDLTP